MVHYLVMEYPVKRSKSISPLFCSIMQHIKMKIMLQLNIFCRHYIQHLGVALNHVLHLSTALMQHSQHQQAKEYVVQDKI